MNKYKIFQLLLLMLLPLIGACSKEDITFDVELPKFELREGYQLLEVIVPQRTNADDKIYIVGPFNGGVEAAVGDPRWQLEKAPDTDAKFGIYLNPSDFVEGKTLADGYTFVNAQQGEERSLDNKPVVHTDAPATGGRINVIVYRWADYFIPSDPGEIDHDGYVIYVVDNSGFDDLALYAWGDAEIFGGWPGVKATGKVTIDGVNYQYFDTGTENEGMNVNLIFNDNGGGKQLADYNVTLNEDFYLELTADGVVPYDPSASIKHDGYTLYVSDLSGWDELYLYMWGDVNDLNGAWPGMPVTGEQTINGVTYKYFDLGAANSDQGLTEHLILNNGNGKQVDDVVVFAIDRDVYVELKSNSASEIDPADYVPSTPEPEPVPDPSPAKKYNIYVENNTGWDSFYIYAWGDKEIFGVWPGAQASSTTSIDGVEYLVFPVEGAGESENLIFNDGNGLQYDAVAITLDRDYYITASDTQATLRQSKRKNLKRGKLK